MLQFCKWISLCRIYDFVCQEKLFFSFFPFSLATIPLLVHSICLVGLALSLERESFKTSIAIMTIYLTNNRIDTSWINWLITVSRFFFGTIFVFMLTTKTQIFSGEILLIRLFKVFWKNNFLIPKCYQYHFIIKNSFDKNATSLYFLYNCNIGTNKDNLGY